MVVNLPVLIKKTYPQIFGLKLCTRALSARASLVTMAVSSSRQRPVYAFEQSHEQLVPNAGLTEKDDGSDCDDGLVAGSEFTDLLLELKHKGKLSAKDVCVLCYWAARAGARGPAKRMSYPPNSQSGKFQPHLDRILGIARDLEEDEYVISTPGYDRHELSRVTLKIPALPPHETLTREWEKSRQHIADLQDQIRNKEWTKAYHDHPVVARAPPQTDVVPLALYLDGVQYQKRQSSNNTVTAFYAYNLLTNRRRLLLTIRKRDVCQCGCKGWCTYHEIFRFLSWSFEALALGKFPSRRHDGLPFGGSERTRLEEANMPCMRGAVVYIKGDWQEFSKTMAIPTWQSLTNPCFACWATKDELYSVGDLSALQSPQERKDANHYDAACANCERQVLVGDVHTHALIVSRLIYDKRDAGNQGRVLSAPLPQLGLVAGDRLEPSDVVPDVGAFEGLASRLPVTVTFWRRQNNTAAVHRNPLFNARTGLSVQNLAIDVLHTLHLGVFKSYCTTALWSLIQADAWNTREPTAEVSDKLNVARCRVELMTWYKEKQRADPDARIYELSDLTLSMLGSREKQHLATKAAETATLMGFCREACQKYAEQLGDRATYLVDMGAALGRVLAIMQENPRAFDARTAQEFVDAIKRAFVLAPLANVPYIPKFHLMLHLGHLALELGNPYYYQTFLDEGYNGSLAKLAATCHSTTFYRRVLAGFRFAHETNAPKRRR